MRYPRGTADWGPKYRVAAPLVGYSGTARGRGHPPLNVKFCIHPAWRGSIMRQEGATYSARLDNGGGICGSRGDDQGGSVAAAADGGAAGADYACAPALRQSERVKANREPQRHRAQQVHLHDPPLRAGAGQKQGLTTLLHAVGGDCGRHPDEGAALCRTARVSRGNGHGPTNGAERFSGGEC